MRVPLLRIVKDSFEFGFKGRSREFLWRIVSIFVFSIILCFGLLLDTLGLIRVEVLAVMLTLIALVTSLVILGIFDPVERLAVLGEGLSYCLMSKHQVVRALSPEDVILDAERCSLVLETVKRELDFEREYNKRANKVDKVAMKLFAKIWSMLRQLCILPSVRICPSFAERDVEQTKRIIRLQREMDSVFSMGIALLEKDLQGKKAIEAIAKIQDLAYNLHERLLPDLKQCCTRLIEKEST